jgi:hypothetical protein
MLHAIRRFCLLFGPVYILATLPTIHGAEAITFLKGAPQACEIVVDGEILKGDFEVFVTQYNNTKFGRVCLNSPGGSYFDGIKIARFINDSRISTRVQADGECYSACAIIFMAGITEVGDFEYRDRTLEPGGTIGFHAPYPVVAEGKFDTKQVEESFAFAMAEAGDLVGFSGSFDSEPTRPPGDKELSAILPRALLAKMLKKRKDDMYLIKTIGDAILSGINIDTHQSSREMSVEDALHIAENFEYAETLGYTTWHKRQWEADFVKRHLGKRFAFLDREKGVVMPFYDGIFPYAYIISPGGCCGNNLNHDIFRISRININYDGPMADLNTPMPFLNYSDLRHYHFQRHGILQWIRLRVKGLVGRRLVGLQRGIDFHLTRRLTLLGALGNTQIRIHPQLSRISIYTLAANQLTRH